MSTSLIVGALSTGRGQIDNLTRYYPVHGGLFTSGNVEANAETPVRDAGVLSNLYVRVPTNTVSVASTVFTLRKSRAATSVTVSYGVDETGVKEDTTNTASFTNTDEVDTLVVTPNEAGTNTITFTVIAYQFAPTDSSLCVAWVGQGDASVFLTTDSVTRYMAVNGALNLLSTEGGAQYRVRTTLTASDLYASANSNTRTSTTTIGTRKNGGAGNQSLTWTSGATGAREDTSNTDSLSAGDDFNYSLTTGTGSGSDIFQVTVLSCSLLSSSAFFPLVSCSFAASTVIAFNTTTYSAASGGGPFSTTLANSEFYPRFTTYLSELQAYASANTIATSDSTVHVMDNGSPSAMTVSYAAAETGLKLDSTNTATLTSATDEVAYQVVTPNTSGSLTVGRIGVLGSDTAPVVLTWPGFGLLSVPEDVLVPVEYR